MPTEITTTVYQFDELNDGAKDEAREWYCECITNEDFDCVIEDAVTIASVLGITINTKGKHGHELYWDLGNGGSVAFNGSYSYAKGATRKVRADYPQDVALNSIAEKLQAIQRRYFYAISGDVVSVHREASVGFRSSDYAWNVDEIIQECIRGFCSWVYINLRREEEYLQSADYIDESIRANEYTFTVDGKFIK